MAHRLILPGRSVAGFCLLILLGRLAIAGDAPIYDPPASLLLPPARLDSSDEQVSLGRESLDHARSAIAAGNHPAARHWLWIAAEQGDAEAQFLFAERYRQGLGVDRDASTALAWFRRSALQGHVAAQNALGEMFRDGQGVDLDDSEAAWWLWRAAEQGFAAAQDNLGEMILQRRIAGQDEAAATAWLLKAATQDYPAAQYRLGVCLLEGRGIAADEVVARRWLARAIAAGHAAAREYLRALDAGATLPTVAAHPATTPENRPCVAC